MREWKIPVVCEMSGIVTVEANTLYEAMNIAYDSDEVPDPEWKYVDGSWDLLDHDTERVRRMYNEARPDDEPFAYDPRADLGLTEAAIVRAGGIDRFVPIQEQEQNMDPPDPSDIDKYLFGAQDAGEKGSM